MLVLAAICYCSLLIVAFLLVFAAICGYLDPRRCIAFLSFGFAFSVYACLALLGVISLCLALFGFSRLCLALLGLLDFAWLLSVFVWLWPPLLGFAWLCLVMFGFSRHCLALLGFAHCP